MVLGPLIPTAASSQKFRKRYVGCLEKESSEFISGLKQVLSLPVPTSVTEAEVQIFFG